MNRKGPRFAWLGLLACLALLVAACGPQVATQAPAGQGPTATALPAGETAAPTQAAATAGPVAVGTLPVDPSDWRAMGPADAAVTFVEYSDFQ